MGELIVVDYTDRRFRAAYARHNRENGAVTYARDLARFHLPIWDAYANRTDQVVRVSTTPLMRHPYHKTTQADLHVQYLHTWPEDDPVRQARLVSGNLPGQRVLYVTAYAEMYRALQAEGFEALYIPMRIDTQRVRKMARYRAGADRPRRFAYYGNLHNAGKPELFREVADATRRFHASKLFHVKGPDQAECLRELAGFTHGVGVGRCALEMMALGLKVLIIGSRFGGMVMDSGDWLAQEAVNFNGRTTTAVSTVDEAVAWWDDAVIPEAGRMDHGTVPALRSWTEAH